ncbi:Solute carrier family 25 member 45 [Neolecta irregularis DAH-3]|uniref:Solute carrier family 25 member 45 n=1 Tax=Neolecta irregularis (strain DAH-3) TaxID=1198029 RepID=A0A1U7LGW2_NEOID|nr:Solute carrier family 25 member 45 [Neolecta irregularis DAH-3]|eukprot:OLL21887.1 Solute carrier family 25 member 45 [Neolecta irregularis DAH-3]
MHRQEQTFLLSVSQPVNVLNPSPREDRLLEGQVEPESHGVDYDVYHILPTKSSGTFSHRKKYTVTVILHLRGTEARRVRSLTHNLKDCYWAMAESINDFVAGYISGVSGLVLGNSLDVRKISVQSSRPQTGIFEPILFFHGILPPLLSLGVLNAILFTCYGQSIRWLNDSRCHPQSWSKVYAAGAISGLGVFFVSTPTELLKCRVQIEKGENTWKVLDRTLRQDGLGGLYRGGLVTVLRDTIGYGFYFWGYEISKHYLDLFSDTQKTFIAGGLAGILSWTSVYPLDVLKTRYQIHSTSLGSLLPQKYSSTWDCAKKTYAEGGAPIFARGLGIATIRAFLVNSVTFCVYEFLYKRLDRYIR